MLVFVVVYITYVLCFGFCVLLFYFVFVFVFFFFFFFKQKTAYEIVSRDWSSDVCSSDLKLAQNFGVGGWKRKVAYVYTAENFYKE